VQPARPKVFARHKVPVAVRPDLIVYVTRWAVSLQLWRLALSAHYQARPVIPEAFRDDVPPAGRQDYTVTNEEKGTNECAT